MHSVAQTVVPVVAFSTGALHEILRLRVEPVQEITYCYLEQK